MSTLIFDSTQGGSISLIGADTSAFYTLNVPATNGTFLISNTNGQATINSATGSSPLTVQVNSSTLFTIDQYGDLICSGTGYFTPPNGTTAQRPASPTQGMFRYNTSLGIFEGYTSGGWGAIAGNGGAVANGVIYQNYTNISANYTLSTATNGFSVGPVTIITGVTVTVPANQRWLVL
jgi:hypothetical protein